MMESDLIAYLKAQTSITDLVGERIFPLTGGDCQERPYVTYQMIDRPRVRSFKGPSGLLHPRLQFDAWAKRYSEAKNIARALTAVLDGFRGTMGTTIIKGILIPSERDDYEPDTELYRVSIDATIWHKET